MTTGPAASGTNAPHGTVADVLGRPLAGAHVTVARDDVVIAETRADADGAFRFAPVVLADGDWLTVAAVAPGAARREAAWTAGASALHLVLADGGTLRGQVLDPDGAVLAGVEVTARHVGDHDRRRTFSAADGSFRIDALPIGRTEVMLFLAGYQLAIVEHRAGDGAPLVLRLERAHGRTLRFRIRGATPEQLAAAECLFFGDSGVELPESCRRGRPNANGVWEVHGLPKDRTFSSLQVCIPGAQCTPDAVFPGRTPRPAPTSSCSTCTRSACASCAGASCRRTARRSSARRSTRTRRRPPRTATAGSC